MKRLFLSLTITTLLFALADDASAQFRRSGGSKGNSNSNGGSNSFRSGNFGSSNGSSSRGNGNSIGSRFGNSSGPKSSASKTVDKAPSNFQSRIGSSKVSGGNNGSANGGSFLDRVRDRNSNGTPTTTKLDRNTIKPQDAPKNTLLDRNPSLRDRVGNTLDRTKIGNAINGNAKVDSKIGNVIDRTKIDRTKLGDSRIGNVIKGGAGKSADDFKSLTGKQKAAHILIGVKKALDHHSGNKGWGLDSGNSNQSKSHHGWGVCAPKHGKGFGFCYRPHQHHVYVNPYCRTRYIAGCDYSVACVPVEQIVVTTAGQTAIDAAIEAFHLGRYDRAADAIEVALREMPHNPDVRLLHSLILFALGDYDNAAAACHTALTASEGWDWEALSSFYASTDTYGIHLRLLENRVLAQPNDPALRFLLGYHYTVLGYSQPAATQLGEVVRMQPQDDVSAQMLNLVRRQAVAVNAPAEQATVENTPVQNTPAEIDFDQVIPPAPVATDAPMTGGLGALANFDLGDTVPVQPQPAAAGIGSLAGNWTANPTSGLVITFAVTADGGFTWTVDRNGETNSFSGTAVLTGNTLVLTRADDGETLTGTATPTAANAFQFQANTEDAPPITFQR